jgi:hypothetical protein
MKDWPVFLSIHRVLCNRSSESNTDSRERIVAIDPRTS